MDRFRFDARQLDSLYVQRLGQPLTGVPGSRRSNGIEETGLRQAIGLPNNALLRDVLSVCDNNPRVTIVAGSRFPIGTGSATTSPLTGGFGASASVAAVMGYTFGVGFYASTIRELGYYLSVGVGWRTNAQASTGPSLTFIFGPPSSFAGVPWGVGADVSFGKGMTFGLGGMILYSRPPCRCPGFAYGCTIGASLLPIDVTAQISTTKTTPLLRGH